MPRPRVKDEDRKRVARACDTCKRRKEKCDGQHPCLLCKRRGREPECTFTDGYSARRKRDSVVSDPSATNGSGSASTNTNISSSDSPFYASNNSLNTNTAFTHPAPPANTAPSTNGLNTPNPPHHRRVTLRDALNSPPGATSSDAEIAIESLLTLSGSRSAPKTPQLEAPDMMFSANTRRPEDAASRAPVPKLARLLKDGHGKFIFVGDSSNLAFVQNIRRLVKIEIGDCGLSSDPLRHSMVEMIPPHAAPPTRDGVSGKGGRTGKPSLAEARDLARHYLLASSGVIDLFDGGELVEELCRWATRQGDEARESELNASIYYLVLAIGAQVRNGKGNESSRPVCGQAEAYLSKGRELVAGSFMDDPSVMTIQSYALITFYMLSACRRNGAFMLLGIAVRAAYALGLHRSDISRLFEKKERKTRERVWKSLRVLDLYMSASLGRPPATSEVDGGSVSWDRASRDYETIQMGGLNSSAMLRICFIFERIMNEVYCRREVTVQLVESISRQYRDWTLQLPAGLQIDGLDQKPGTSSPTLQQTIGVAHLKGAYYWSIILLTRPFLIFKVSGKIKGREEKEGDDGSSVTSTLSEACIDAALRSVEIATDLIHTPGVPKRLFQVTNSTFVSAMVIGFAIFGDFDRSFPLMSSINQAVAILAIMARDDASARRYEQITTHLRNAASEHIRRREATEMEKRRHDIHEIFGDPIKETPPAPKPLEQGLLIPTDFPDPDGGGLVDNLQQQGPWSLRFDMPPESRGPILTTSGALAEGGEQPPMDFSTYDMDQNVGVDEWSPSGSGVPSLPSYAEEFPLFSLMTEYDQLQGGHQFPLSRHV